MANLREREPLKWNYRKKKKKNIQRGTIINYRNEPKSSIHSCRKSNSVIAQYWINIFSVVKTGGATEKFQFGLISYSWAQLRGGHSAALEWNMATPGRLLFLEKI